MRYELAAAILPSRLRRIAYGTAGAGSGQSGRISSAGRTLYVCAAARGRTVTGGHRDPQKSWKRCATLPPNFSRYASMETLRQGFLPVRGGFRVGLCGSAVMKDGAVTNLKQISSAVIRISREQRGIAP